MILAGGAAPALADVPRATTAYVKGRAADADGRVEAAAASYAAALAAAPDNPVVAVRAYREALAAGDMALARNAAAILSRAGVAPADTSVLTVADAIRAKRWGEARAATLRMADGPLAFLGPVVNAWIDLERGVKDPAAPLKVVGGNALARRFNSENHALLLIADGDEAAGAAELRAILGIDAGNIDLRITASQLLAGRGERKSAQALFAGDDPLLVAYRDGIGKGSKPTAAYGVSRNFTRLAADLASSDARQLAIVLGRAALELNPRDDRVRLVLAEALARDGATAAALGLLDAIDPDSGAAIASHLLRITVLTRLGRADDALKLADTNAKAPGATSEDMQRYGDLLSEAGRYDAAAKAYRTALERAGPAAEWTLYLQLGGALEQAGQWDAAEAMLARAVELAPEEAVALNYLGYARIERGKDMAEARAMLERAAKLKPDDAAIADSLGWAYVRGGEVGKGLPLLERAARAEPADVTIQEHLGDAYWQLGRRYEARYAWSAAKVYADSGEAARLSGKLAGGLSTAAK